jgi:16S rRNA (cytidine1402-2'-O)-methyltransferase
MTPPEMPAAEQPAGDPIPQDRKTAIARLVARVAAEIETRATVPLVPGLYLVATPIGNLADVTLRALLVLATADEVYCEDTRQSQKLLARFGIERRLGIYHEHNAERERPRLMSRLADGRTVALISDAGMPLISDPGFKLARHAIEEGHSVFALPGASATLTALAVSGLPTDCFHFAGFLPSKSGARRSRIEDLAQVSATLILFEAPPRLADSLQDMAEVLGDRPAAVARELTKLHEEIKRGPLSALAAWAKTHPLKGEIVVVIGPPLEREIGDPDIVAALKAAPPGARLADCARDIATRLGGAPGTSPATPASRQTKYENSKV